MVGHELFSPDDKYRNSTNGGSSQGQTQVNTKPSGVPSVANDRHADDLAYDGPENGRRKTEKKQGIAGMVNNHSHDYSKARVLFYSQPCAR